MIELQIISKIINDKDFGIIQKNNINEKYFIEFTEEFNFIKDHYNRYRVVPDISTMLGKFPDLEIIPVKESEVYLVGALREEHLYHQSVPVLREVSNLLKEDSFKAFQFLKDKLPQLLANNSNKAIDLIGDGDLRYNSLEKRATNRKTNVIKTGLAELDKGIYGWMCGEELVTLVARTGEGKTWLLMWFMVAAWQQGFTVGIYSGEMTAEKIGYRFDTILQHFSNTDLIRGTIPNLKEYETYIKELKEKNLKPFWIITPRDLGGRATVSQLEAFVETHKLDILGIDQFTLMRDEKRSSRSDTREELEHISADLFDLSVRQGIPIIALTQANRSGAKKEGEKGTPDVESIYGSDSIAQNSTKIISFRSKGSTLELSIKKNRDGARGDKYTYSWDPDRGTMHYVASEENEDDKEDLRKVGNMFKDKREVF